MKHVYKCLTILFLLCAPLYAVETDLECATKDQITSNTALWKCPTINNSTKAKLSHVNLESGKYRCDYFQNDGAKFVKGCEYRSTYYISESARQIKQKTEDLNAFKAVDFNTEYPIIPVDVDASDTLKTKVDWLSAVVNDYLTKLSQFDYWKSTHAYFSTLAEVHKIRELSYTHLVKPYVTNATNADAEKGDTFSRFITGMVTLDPEVVYGYDEINGTLMIQPKWAGKQVNVSINPLGMLKNLKNYFNQEQNKSNTSIGKFSITDTHSWISIFKMKIWGFYYNLQRRLDIGYDILSTQLLFFMMAFFAMGAAARGGARYITSREDAGSSGELKVNEASIMKTLGILATVFVFYFSIPSEISSNNEITQESDINSESKTNMSMAKGFIRYAMKEGSYLGTMMADLGTDAFLEYVIQKQGLYTGLREKITLFDDLKEMVYYYPALQIVNECVQEYNTLTYDKLSSFSPLETVQHNPHYNQNASAYLSNNNIIGTKPNVCEDMINRVINVPARLVTETGITTEMMDNSKYIRIEATKALVKNHINLQEELGWMNIIAVPYTYFMLKNQELFFENTLDFKSIESQSDSFMQNVGLINHKDVLKNAPWFTGVETEKRITDVISMAEQNKKFARYAFYNFLPMFGEIKSEILQRLQSIYSDILRVSVQGGTGTKVEKIKTKQKKFKKYIEEFTRLLKNKVEIASKIYQGPISLSKIKKSIAILNSEEPNPVQMAITIQLVAYTIAMAIWKSGFTIVFLSAIGMIIGFKIILYVIDVLIHFFVAPFVVLWAFATGEGGNAKIRGYLRDTLVYMLYPSIIVIGVFVFIFAYELFYTLYAFIMNVLIEGQADVIGTTLAGQAFDHNKINESMSYLNIYALRDLTEIMIDLLSAYVAFVTIHKFPEMVFKMLGLGDSGAIMMVQSVEKLSGKGGGSVNPMSR